jgi:hypothetical protein
VQGGNIVLKKNLSVLKKKEEHFLQQDKGGILVYKRQLDPFSK